MTKQIKVIQPWSRSCLSEAMQSKKIRYAFVKDEGDNTYKCITPYVLCRDYLKDLLFVKNVTKEGIGTVYGFDTNKYNHADIHTDKTLMAVTGDEKMINTIEENWGHMVELENNHGVEPTQVTRFVDGDTHGLLVEGDPRWCHSVLGFSYYSFLFRLLAYTNLNCAGTVDSLLKDSADTLAKYHIDKINQFGFLDKLFKKHDISYNSAFLYSLHNYFGLMFVDKKRETPIIKNPYTVF